MSGLAVDAIDVVMNGRSESVPRGSTIAEAIAALGLAGRRFAVEVNGAIVPRSRHGSTALATGDRVEIVVAVGGG